MTPEQIEDCDARLRSWRQGDVVLTPEWPAIRLVHLASPGSDAAAALAADGGEVDFNVIAEPSPGFMVLSQTCDIVRTCAERHYVEVCPLQVIPADKMALVRAGRMGRYLWVPGLNEENLAADLDRPVTFEKTALLLHEGERRPGVETEAGARQLAEALGRKRSRAALPDDFVDWIRPLQRRVQERHHRQTAEGTFLRAARELRVVASPDWAADVVDVELLAVFNRNGEDPGDAAEQVMALAQRVEPAGRFRSLTARVVSLDRMTAASLIESDRLDLDHLSD